MGRIRNMGTSTMRFNEGIVVSGSIDTSYASKEGVAIVCTGSLEIAANGTNSQVVRIISNDSQREMVFDSLGTSGGGSAQAAFLNGNGSGGLRLQDPYSQPGDGALFKINDGTSYEYYIRTSNYNVPNASNKINIARSADRATMQANIIAAINGTATTSQAKYNAGNSSNRAAVTALANGAFNFGINLTANVAGTGGNSFTFQTNDNTLSVTNSTQAFAGGSASGGGSSTTQETIASIFTETDDDLVVSGSKEVHIRSGESKAVMILSGTIGGATSPNPSNFTDTNLFVSGTIDSMGTAVKGTSVFGGDLHVSGAAQINSVTVLSNGRVGIGTDNPGFKLEVGGSMAIGEYVKHRNDEDTYLRFQDNDVRISAGGNENLTVKSINVGIGTVSPDDSYNLHISGSSITSVLIGEGGSTGHQSTRESKLLLTADKGNSSVTGSIVVQSPGGSFAHDMQIGTLSNHNLEFFTNNTERVIIKNSGNVAIGSSDALFPLDITGETIIRNSSAESDLGLYRHNASITTNMELGRLFIGGSEDNTNFYPGAAIVSKATENWTPASAEGTELNFWTTPNTSATLTQRMVISNDGKVGIGESTPDTTLHVKGTGITNESADNAVSFIDMYRMDDAVNSNDEVMQIRIGAKNLDGSGAAYGGQIVAKSAGAWDSVTHSPTNFLVNLSSNTDLLTTRLFVSASGETGIGTLTPDSKLHVYNSTSANLKLQTGGDSTLIIDSGNSSNSIINFKKNNSNKWNILNNNSNDVLNINSNTGTAITIEQDGDVGIGTGTPIAKLDVAGKIAITSEASTPSQPADGKGYVYSKNDGKLYWRSHDISEVDLTSGANAAGSTQQVMFNNAGSFAGDNNLKFNSSNARLSLGGLELANRLTIFESADNSVENGDGNASNYGMVICATDTANTGSSGIGFSRDSGNNIGGAIYFRATDANSKGQLRFATKRNNSNGITPAVRMKIQAAGAVELLGDSIDVAPTNLDVGSGTGNGWFTIGHRDCATECLAFDPNTIQAKAQTSGDGATLFVNSFGGDVSITATNSGKVGIGDPTPTSKLHVATDEASQYVGRFFNDGNNANRYGVRISCGKDSPDTNGDIVWHMFADGNGTNLAQAEYHTTGDNYRIVGASDERIKIDIADTSVNATEIFKQIQMKAFKKVRNGVAGPLDPLGFIAQNLEPLIPNMVSEYDSEEHDFKVKHIGTVTFIPYLVKAVQELIEKNEQLEAKIRTLEG